MKYSPLKQPPGAIRHGFTLIELLMVVVIVGLMALIVLPRIRIDNTQVDTAVRTVSMAFMVAQRDAVARQHNVLIVFDTVAHTVRTVWDVNNSGTEGNAEKARPFLLPERVVLGRPRSVPSLGAASRRADVAAKSFSRGPYFIIQRSGSADRSEVMYFTTISTMNGGPDRDVRALAIARATGRAVWYKWTGTAWRRG